MKVVVSGTLQRYVGYQREMEVEASTIREAIVRLETQHGALRNVLRDGEGSLRAAHQLFVNGEQIGPNALDREVARTDVLEVLTAIAGG